MKYRAPVNFRKLVLHIVFAVFRFVVYTLDCLIASSYLYISIIGVCYPSLFLVSKRSLIAVMPVDGETK